ncbi:thiamine-phosphate kinase [Chloroflexota bacterium]
MMKVSELGEFGLIDLLAKMVSSSQNKQLPPHQQLIIGIGDDAAAWHGDASIHLATVDSLIQDVHFSLDIMSWKELGWKSLAVNLSDIAAMGGVPGYVLVSLALPGNTEVEDVAALYEGMIELAQQFEVAIVGGDTCQAPMVSITVTVLGNSCNKHVLSRATAKPGDKVAVTGYLGGAAAGLEKLTNSMSFKQEAAKYFKDAFLRPLPRIAEGQLLVKQGVTTAIDISDGLLSDLRHICKASQVNARVEVDLLPIQPMVRDNFGDRALEMALAGGEDYELLFTASPEVINRVNKGATCPVTIIGEIFIDKPGEISLVDADGNPINPAEAGWEHFKAR